MAVDARLRGKRGSCDCLDARPGGRIYNVGEEHTPTVAERLARLPRDIGKPGVPMEGNFAQDIVYDTSRIREELGYVEVVSEEEGIRRTLS